MTFRKHSVKISGILTALLLGGCITTSLPLMRAETAQRVAAPAWLLKRDIPAGEYALRAYERMHERNKPANIYIEGNGLEHTSQFEFNSNPTPKYPLALHLASKDNADNVVYLAQPCQYNGLNDGSDCTASQTWNADRFSDDKLRSFNAALDDIARRYDITGFHLIGYDDGGAIAALLAATRHDILSLRTAAGNLSPYEQRALLQKTPLSGSINPADHAHALARIPQYHFIGAQDHITPPSVFHAYKQSLPPDACTNSMLVQEAEHEDGWVNKWPELLKLPLTCIAPPSDSMYPADPVPKHHTTIIPEKPEKP